MTYDLEAAEWKAKRRFPELAGFHIPPSRKRRTSSFDVSVMAEKREEPSGEQAKAYTWFLGHEESICRKVVRAIAVYYKWLRQKERAWFDDYDCHEVETGDDLRDLMEFGRLYVRRDHFRGSALLGFSFECKWDEEHGLGVLTHRSHIIDVGQAEVAYHKPAEASSMWLPICTAGERAAAMEVIKAVGKPSRRLRQASGAPRRGERKKAGPSADLYERLWSAILDGDRVGAQKLLQQGADINLVGQNLFSAIGMCNVEAVQFMIDAGAALDIRNRYGNTLIEWTHKIIEMIPRPEQRLRRAVRDRMLRRAAEVLRLLEAAGAK